MTENQIVAVCCAIKELRRLAEGKEPDVITISSTISLLKLQFNLKYEDIDRISKGGVMK